MKFSVRHLLSIAVILIVSLPAFSQSITGITPVYAVKGQTLNVTITGASTHFTQTTATTVSFFRAGSPTSEIAVNYFSSATGTTIVANVTVSSSATIGAYDLKVSDLADGFLTLANGFFVSNTGSKSISTSPSNGTKGQTLNVTITGANTNFASGSNTLTFFGQGTSTAITVNSLTAINSSQMKASVTVTPGAAAGPYDVRLTTITDGLLIQSSGFVVIGPYITTVAPSVGLRGNTYNLSVTGVYTHFSQGYSSVNMYRSGSPTNTLKINFATPTSDTSMMVNVTVPASSPLGIYVLSLNDSIDGTINYTSAFSVQSGSLAGITPSTALRGQTLNVTITGNGTAFTQGSTTVSFYNSGSSTAIVVNSINVSSSNTLVANISIQPYAVVGNYDLRVSSPLDGLLQVYSAFTVTGPTINSVAPTTFYRGAKLDVNITGTNTHFNQGTQTVTFFYQGSPTSMIHIDSTSSSGATSLKAFVKVSKTASGGYYQLRTYNPSDYEVIYPTSIMVNNPQLVTITPSIAHNKTTLDVMITGTGTNFTQASSTNFSFFYSGTPTNSILVNNVLAVNDSIADMKITIGPNTLTGYYILRYSNVYDGLLQIGFTVDTSYHPAPTFQFSPAWATRGKTLDMAITGNNTSFLQASSTLSIAFMKQAVTSPFISVNSKAISSDNLIKINVTVDSASVASGVYSLSIGNAIDGFLTPPYPFTVTNTGINPMDANENRFKIYPNPAKNLLTLELNSIENITLISMYDMLGKALFEIPNPVLNNGTMQIDLTKIQLPPGTYFIQLINANGIYHRKILVE